MKTILVAVLACVLSSSFAFAKDNAKAEMDPKQQEMMKKWKEASTPGDAHKVLQGMAGNWTYKSKFWESKDAAPQESKGTSTFKMILGGRYLEHRTKGKAMGMPFEGFGITGYDNLKKKYETVWFDNMGTGIMKGEGEYDAATKILKESGEFSCPMQDDHEAEYKSEWKIIDKNDMTYAMWGPDMNGDEIKMMEMTFKRQ